LLLVIVPTRFKTIHEVFATENKKVCFHDSLYGVMEREYPTNVDKFRNSSMSDTERLLSLQSNKECDGVVISRYSLSYISTLSEFSCDSLYPLYDEDLFAQEVVIAISQTLGELGNELVNVMDIMASKNLYRDKHDNYMSNLSEGCEFEAQKYRKGVEWESFFLPLIFSVGLASIAFFVGCTKYICRRKSMQTENTEKDSPQCIAEPGEELASLLDDDDDLNKFSSEVKRLNEESEERITKRIIQTVESNIIKLITVDNERAMKRMSEENERVMEYTIKRITDDNICVMKQVIECTERILKHTKQNQELISYTSESSEKNELCSLPSFLSKEAG